MIVQEPVKAAIWHCLNYYDFKDAIFLAERLCSEVETDETIFILATSYYRSNQIQQAYWLLKEKSCRSSQCRYLQAKCAYQLKRYAEAECALTCNNFGDLKNFDELTNEFGEIACFALQLISQICNKTERTKMAAEALHRALKLNPFLWHAFTDLCQIDDSLDTDDIFQINTVDIFKTCQSNANFIHSNILFDASAANADQNKDMTDHTNEVFLINLASVANNQPNIGGNNDKIANIQQHKFIPKVTGEISDSMYCTPTEQFTTPNNNNNSSSILRSCETGTPHNNLKLEEISTEWLTSTSEASDAHDAAKLQAAHILAHMDELMGSSGSNSPSSNLNDVSGSETTGRSFKYLQSVCPLTPSFGVLPLSPSTNESPIIEARNVSSTVSSLTAFSPEPQEPKIMRKKVRVQNNSTVTMAATSLATNVAPTHNVLNRSHNALSPTNARSNVFSQSANITSVRSSANNMLISNNTNNSTGLLPGVGGGVAHTAVIGGSDLVASAINCSAVRRSSRLFGSNNCNSVKENTKTQNLAQVLSKFTQPCSPPRKTKTPRIPKICINNELIDEKYVVDKFCERKRLNDERKEKPVKISEKVSSPTVITNTAEQKTSKLLYNGIFNVQPMVNHVLNLKKNSANGLMSLLREFATGYKMLIKFDCKHAIIHFETHVPNHHLNSCWLQSMIGLAYYELRKYEAAVKIFKAIREAEPYRMEFMEIYSSSLWHLQREVDLSALSHDFIQHNKLSPVTWCAAGNCFSLHKEHETAIKFFKRAVQVDADFVYSYTLLGHELVLAEELDKAMDYFRAAVVRDPRHYNAWFGMGTIYSKQEKYELAELHYLKAFKINPKNSVILVHIGAMQYCMGKKEKALVTLNSAAALEPKNPLARFHRGSIYFALGRHQEALNELEELKKIVPKESVVFYLIGKIHKQLGNIDLALMHFSWATDLDPKGANNQIKDAFDSMSHQNCCQTVMSDDGDMEPTSERSDDGLTHTNQEFNYDSDVY